MSLLKRFYYGCTSRVPLQLLIKASPVSSFFPYHHIVSDEEVPHIIHLYPYKNTRQFTEDLEFILKHFEPIAPSDLVSHIEQHHRLPQKKFLFTFDDGFKEVYEVIAPLMKAKGIPAIFFINPAFIDNKEMFYRNKISLILGVLKRQQEDTPLLKKMAELLSAPQANFSEVKTALLKIDQRNKKQLDEIGGLLGISFAEYLNRNTPWLTSDQLAQLAGQGFCIGAHSWDHPYYQSLSLNEQIEQTVESCNYVRRFRDQKTIFSFPHSDQNLPQQLFDQLVLPEHGIDLFFGVQNQKNEIRNKMIHRFNAERPDLSLQTQLKGMLAYTGIQKLFNKQTIHRLYA